MIMIIIILYDFCTQKICDKHCTMIIVHVLRILNVEFQGVDIILI